MSINYTHSGVRNGRDYLKLYLSDTSYEYHHLFPYHTLRQLELSQSIVSQAANIQYLT
jgi:hypothetical protein